MGKLSKTISLVLVVASLGLTGYLVWDFQHHMGQLPERKLASLPDAHAAVANAGDGHGAPAADAHGAPPADGGHGGTASPPAEGGHGDGHGGAAAAAAAEPEGVPMVSLDEVFVNVGGPNGPVRSMGIKLDLELFEEKDRTFLDERRKGILDAILQTSREQEFVRLSTVQGKLYFKELLASRINEFLKAPAVREVHFSSFFLQ